MYWGTRSRSLPPPAPPLASLPPPNGDGDGDGEGDEEKDGGGSEGETQADAERAISSHGVIAVDFGFSVEDWDRDWVNGRDRDSDGLRESVSDEGEEDEGDDDDVADDDDDDDDDAADDDDDDDDADDDVANRRCDDAKTGRGEEAEACCRRVALRAMARHSTSLRPPLFAVSNYIAHIAAQHSTAA